MSRDVAPAAQGQSSWYSTAWIGIDGNTPQSVSAEAHG
jgi:hypothetical protein